MIANRLLKPWRIFAGSLLVMGLICVVVAAQDGAEPDQPQADEPPMAAEQPADEKPAVEQAASSLEEASTPAADNSFPPPVDIADVETPDWMKRVDNGFGQVVSILKATLFYTVFPDEQQYAQENYVLYYWRSEGTDDPFKIAENSKARKPADMPDEATLNEVSAWVETGKAAGSGDPDKPYRQGKLTYVDREGVKKTRSVEYVKYVINDSTKYVLDKDGDQAIYKPLRKVRSALSTDKDEWKTPEQIREMALAGEMAIDFKANGQETPYIFTEYIGGVPLVVIWLSGGAILFTLYFGLVNFWGVPHAINVVRGTYDNPNEPGEVTHFQALASALSATVGLGNIAGVTIAMTDGGPGAFFWMILCGFFGMTSKFVECTLGQMYREVKPDGTILGGPMQYLVNSFEQFGLRPVGVFFSIVFAIMCVMASFGGGNMFQGNQAASQVLSMVPNTDKDQLKTVQAELKTAAAEEDFDRLPALQTRRKELLGKINSFENQFKIGFGIIMAALVGLVIIGGIKRIGATAGKIVPAMCLMYILACLWIICTHYNEIPGLVSTIFTQAFNPDAVRGGLIGVIVIGVRRAAFSNEAGVGSAAIAHSAAKTDEPVREGFVALLEPFIDTIVVCSMTALVILITGAWDSKELVHENGMAGVELTSAAFSAEISWFPYILTLAVVLFAFSTIISWSYYGERCWERLFGARAVFLYKIIFVIAVFLGPIFSLNNVLDFSDFMILSMAFPNILGCLLLAPTVKRAVTEYWRKLKAGEFNISH